MKQAIAILKAYNPALKKDADKDTDKDAGIEDNEKTMEKVQGLFSTYLDVKKINPQFPVYYDAWANDNDMDPLLSLIYHIGDSYDYFDEKGVTDKNKVFIELVKSTLKLTSFGGLDNLVDLFKSENILKDLQEAQKIDIKIHEFFESLPIEKGNRLVIFVDELDRCRPDFAVRLLERIKHYFDLNNVTFVFSVNMSELSHTITQFYGDGFDSGRYLTRFFDYVVHLPEADLKSFSQCLSPEENLFTEATEKVARYFHFELRDLARYQQAIHLVKKEIYNRYSPLPFVGSEESYNFYTNSILPILIGIQVVKPDSYQDFIDGNGKADFIAIMKEVYSSSGKEIFLKDGESFDGHNNTVRIDYSVRLGELYDAIFKDSTDLKMKDEKRVGKIKIIQSVKTWLIKVASQLSDYSDYNE